MALTGLLGTQDSQPGAFSPGVVDTPASAIAAGTSTLTASGVVLSFGSATAAAASSLTVTGVVVVSGTAVLSAGSSLRADAALLRRYAMTIVLRDASGLLAPVPSAVLR